MYAVPMPTLFEFTFMTSEESFNATRWSMLTWLFELERDFVENLKTTSFSFTAVILTLQYLRQVKCFRFKTTINKLT